MKCYKPSSGCGVYEMRSCNECPYSKPRESSINLSSIDADAKFIDSHTGNPQYKKCDISDAVIGKQIKVSDYFDKYDVPMAMKNLSGTIVTISDVNYDMIKISECDNRTAWFNIELFNRL